MSSATVLYVLERFMDKTDLKGTKGLMPVLDLDFQLKGSYYSFKDRLT
jgi:predicted naringenin-chalcone synthase